MAPTSLAQSRLFLTNLILFAMLGPFAMTAFVPALPVIGDSFDVSTAVSQLALTLSLLGTAVASLGYGKLSDRSGWRNALLVSLALAALGSLMAAVGTHIGWVIAGRLLQAVGAGSAFVLVRVIVHQTYGGHRAMAMMGYVTAAMAIAPMIGPLCGGLLLDHLGWRAIFLSVGIAAVLLFFVTAAVIPASAASRPVPADNKPTSWVQLLRRPEYLRFVIVSVGAMTTFYGFVSAAPHLLIGDKGAGLSATQYGAYYMIVPLGFLTGSMLAGRLGIGLGNNRLCLIGSSVGALGCVIGLVMVWFAGAQPLAIVVPMAICALGAGLGMAGSQAGMVASSPDQPGVASGLAAFGQLALSALMVQIIGVIVDMGPIAVSAALVVSSLVGLIGYAWWTRSASRQSGCAIAT